MKINCVSCGHRVDLDNAYGNYDGPIRCFVCNSLLEVKITQGDIISVKLGNLSQKTAAEADPPREPIPVETTPAQPNS